MSVTCYRLLLVGRLRLQFKANLSNCDNILKLGTLIHWGVQGMEWRGCPKFWISKWPTQFALFLTYFSKYIKLTDLLGRIRMFHTQEGYLDVKMQG